MNPNPQQPNAPQGPKRKDRKERKPEETPLDEERKEEGAEPGTPTV